MKLTHLRLPEVTAATLISTVVLLVAVAPALVAAPANKAGWNPAGRTSAVVVAAPLRDEIRV